MITRVRRLLRSEEGFSLIELMATMILSGLIAASLIAVFNSMSQNSADLSAKANTQADARAVMSELVVELRQAVKSDLNADHIESLSADRLAFATQDYENGQMVRVVYERTDCVEGRCELWVHRYGVEESDGITTTFFTDPFESSFLMGNVLSDQPLFVGIEYAGDPLVRTQTTACSVDCDFPVVAVTLRARPTHTSAGASVPIEYREEVRIRAA